MTARGEIEASRTGLDKNRHLCGVTPAEGLAEEEGGLYLFGA